MDNINENKPKTEEAKKEPKTKQVLLKSLFIVAILAVIIILAFAVIRFLPFVFSSFASVGSLIKSPFDQGINLKANETDLASGEVFRLNFNYSPKENGHYSLSYECAPNLSIASVVDERESRLECNRRYRIPDDDKFIDLKAVLNKENFYTETEINVSYINQNQDELTSDAITISVANESDLPISDLSGSATITSQDVEEEPQTSTGQTSTTNTAPFVPSIPADLTITNARAIDDTTVVFDISNIGGRPTGNWYFNYTIPGESVEISPLQMSLNPGQAMRFTLRFDEIDEGNTMIIVDPQNLIRENSEANNSRTIYVRGDDGGSNSSYYNYDRNDDADLVIRNLEVGRMSGSRFVEDDEIDEDDDAAVRFEVVNIGGESTGRWRFEIDETPYDGSNNDYRSGRQNSLRPGESVVLIVEFENPDDGRYRIEVDIDSDDDVDEENERNNDDSEVLEVEG